MLDVCEVGVLVRPLEGRKDDHPRHDLDRRHDQQGGERPRDRTCSSSPASHRRRGERPLARACTALEIIAEQRARNGPLLASRCGARPRPGRQLRSQVRPATIRRPASPSAWRRCASSSRSPTIRARAIGSKGVSSGVIGAQRRSAHARRVELDAGQPAGHHLLARARIVRRAITRYPRSPPSRGAASSGSDRTPA